MERRIVKDAVRGKEDADAYEDGEYVCRVGVE
jgi:hypothetical protein